MICETTGKRALSKSDAIRALNAMLGEPKLTQADRERLNVYRCTQCGRWHVGNKGLRRAPRVGG